jgi:hypothetical protein
MDAEQKMVLQKKWRVAKAVMARACWSLPSPTSVDREQFEASVSRFHEFIQVNELGPAFEELGAAAELVDCQGSVWRDLERAAVVMGLYGRVPYLRERFRAATIRGVRGDRRRGNAMWSRRIASHLVTWFRAPR